MIKASFKLFFIKIAIVLITLPCLASYTDILQVSSGPSEWQSYEFGKKYYTFKYLPYFDYALEVLELKPNEKDKEILISLRWSMTNAMRFLDKDSYVESVINLINTTKGTLVTDLLVGNKIYENYYNKKKFTRSSSGLSGLVWRDTGVDDRSFGIYAGWPEFYKTKAKWVLQDKKFHVSSMIGGQGGTWKKIIEAEIVDGKLGKHLLIRKPNETKIQAVLFLDKPDDYIRYDSLSDRDDKMPSFGCDTESAFSNSKIRESIIYFLGLFNEKNLRNVEGRHIQPVMINGK